MAFQPQHIGLYFGSAAIEDAQRRRTAEDDLGRAWAWLAADAGTVLGERPPLEADEDPKAIIKPDLDGVPAAHVDAIAYRFGVSDGQQALQMLARSSANLDSAAPHLAQLMDAATYIHTAELLHAHPQMQAAWRTPLAEYAQTLCARPTSDIVERAWQMLVMLISSVMGEDEAGFAAAAGQFRHLVDTQIHPGGYLRDAVQEQPGNTFLRQVLGVCALALAAEAATQAGTDLWAYENRGVGVATAAAYPLFYFFYPEKWQWEDDLTSAKTRQVFYQHGAFMEMVKARAALHSVGMLLEQIRPCYSPHAGGLTTLSHFHTARRKRRRWFR